MQLCIRGLHPPSFLPTAAAAALSSSSPQPLTSAQSQRSSMSRMPLPPPSPPPSLSSKGPTLPFSPKKSPPMPVYKDLHFNRDLSATKKLQVGVDLVARLVGVTLGPKGRNVVLGNKYGPPKIVNDGETVLKEIELEDPLENLGVKLVRQAGARTNDIAGDGCTTSIILAQGLIAEGMKVLAAGMNPVQIARGIGKTSDALVSELKLMSREIEDHEIVHVAAVSAGNDYTVGNMISDAFKRVGREGMVRIENGRGIENSLEIVEGMQFERGYLSPYFVTNHASMSTEFTDCKILLVDKIISDPRELLRVCFSAVKEDFPLLIIAEDVEEEALATLTRNKLSGMIKVAATKAPSFGEQKTQCLEDIAIITGGTVVREDMGYTLEEAGKEVLGFASKVVIKNDSTLIVTDGSTLHAVEKRVAQMKGQIENSKERYQKKILGERIARLCGAIAIIQVGAQTVIELKDKKLRIEDALNATMAAIEEGVVVGGGCSLLRLSKKIDIIKESLDNAEQKIGADIFKNALSYPTTLIANNAGMSGKFVVEKVIDRVSSYFGSVLSNDNISYGYNAANGSYEDLMAAGILDPTKVVRCCIEHAAVVAKSFLTSDVVIVEAQESKPVRVRPPMPPRNLIPPIPASVSGIRV
ncbi:ruBisCO large subunit-binding protein subunit beta, chloroplastic isoform X1 [Lolium perenne]|uniref:ruBisCO large subunit-binding protein subunit beta, chloroplastic isoform X1 n=1 Tax=Lolium perenne TaxID=4522 RepID=UPI003A9A43BF